MRRLAVCAFVVLTVGLVLAPGALASTGVRHATTGARHATAAATPFRLSDGATYAISGNALDYAGTGVPGAEVDWGWWDTTGNYNFGGTNMPLDSSPGTDSAGKFSFDAVTSAPVAGNDDLTIWYPFVSPADDAPAPYLWRIETWTNTFATTADYPIRPAKVDLTVTGISDALANGSAPADVWVAGTPGSAATNVWLTGGAGVAFAAPTSFNDVTVGFPDDLGRMTAAAQWQGSDVSVTAGTEDTSPVSLDLTTAHHAYLAGPLCQHSGKPGSIVKLMLKGWPAGQQAGFYLQGSALSADFSNQFTSTGATAATSLRIPANAPVDLYEVHAYRVDSGDLNGMPDVWDMFQTCTFKASATAIHHGKAVRLSGTVPGSGKATVYARTKVSGQPATTAAKGWVRVGRYTINKSGKFASVPLHPKRTTWYVVLYKGYDFTAFTSVIRVAVH